jgi:membrane-associated protease RseP (regulator of RpoE activity)
MEQEDISMMRTVSLSGAVLAALVLLVSPLVAATSDGEDATTKKIRIHKVYTDCDEDEEDCESLHQGAHRVIIAGDDHHAIHFAGGGHALAGAYLGVQLTDLTPELRTHFGVGEDNGVMIAKIVDDSPAWRAGLQVGDIITAVDTQEVKSGGSLARAIRGHEEGEQVSLEVWRDGRLETITATLEKRQSFLTAGRGVHVVCDDDEEDCDVRFSIITGSNFDCDGAEECEAQIECKDGTCTCTVNGEITDCEELHHPRHDRD